MFFNNRRKIERLENECASLKRKLEASEFEKERLLEDIATSKKEAEVRLESKLAVEANRVKVLSDKIEQLQQQIIRTDEALIESQQKRGIYNPSIDFEHLGIYIPKYDYGTAEEFKIEVAKVRELIKAQSKKDEKLSPEELAIVKKYSISINSEAIGKFLRFAVRAFNIEASLCINDVSWANIVKMEQRIRKAAEEINEAQSWIRNNKLISEDLINLRLQELHLAYEFICQQKKDAEERRRRADEIREQAKVEREIQAAIDKAEKEEAIARRMLEREQQRYNSAPDSEKESLLLKIRELEARLSIAEDNRERAMSMAQQTKKGHIYIISNIGSFGEGVYKIGMSRRLDPTERVKELGDASVPFPFDIHAMIYSDNAPELEHKLHKRFEDKRVNMTTNKKEFFRVQLEEIEKAVSECGINATFEKIADAQAFWETQAIIAQLQKQA